MAYLEQKAGALQAQLRSISSEALPQPSPELDGTRTIYEWVKAILKGCLRHLGEIQALKTIMRQGEARLS